jgi:hypothetical protein
MSDDGLKIFEDQRAVPEDSTARMLPAAIATLVVLSAFGLLGLLWLIVQIGTFLAFHSVPAEPI